MNQQSDSPVDIKHLHQISQGDVEFEIEVLQVYLEDNLQKIEKIREAIADEHPVEIMHEAHYIKGASGNVGARQMQKLATELEDISQSQNSDLLLTIVDNMLIALKSIELFIEGLATK
ncbi:Hpt domain-containing protein [Pseudanabaena biceps]|nr:Hpt domain-containing protein [Pseudanabaena biceps]